VAQRRSDAAEGTEARLWPVGETGPAGGRTADQHDVRDIGAQRRGGMVDQRNAAQRRLRLVGAEAGRAAAGQDRAEDQRSTSIRTGTDFPAGTWLSSA
jgi:hypothetical protein